MAFGIDDAIAAGLKILDKFVADPEAKAKAQLELEHINKDMKIANLEADKVEAQEITKRQQYDMASDSWLSKNIRPLMLIALFVAYTGFALASVFDYDTKSAYVDLLGQWGMLAFGFYFGSRGAEKVAEIWANKKT